MPRSHWTALRTVLLVATLLAGLVAVRWLVTGGLNRPMAPPAPPRPAPVRIAHAPPGTRLSLGGRQPIVIDPATGSIARIAPGSGDVTELFRQGGSTVLVADRRVWAVPAGRVGPPRPLGEAAIALPALADDRVWLVDARYGASGRQRYVLVEVGLADGRVHTRWTLPYQTAPIAVLPSGLLARGLQDDLEVVEPGSGRVRAVLARTARFVDARGGRVAWLELRAGRVRPGWPHAGHLRPPGRTRRPRPGRRRPGPGPRRAACWIRGRDPDRVQALPRLGLEWLAVLLRGRPRDHVDWRLAAGRRVRRPAWAGCRSGPGERAELRGRELARPPRRGVGAASDRCRHGRRRVHKWAAICNSVQSSGVSGRPHLGRSTGGRACLPEALGDVAAATESG